MNRIESVYLNDDNNDISRWNIIYPNYLNKKKKIKEGRKININFCVSDPSVHEISLACKELNIPCVIEQNKCYPRDWLVEGRVRIKMPTIENGKTNKFALMRQIGSKLQTIKANIDCNPSINQNTLTKKKKEKDKEKKKKKKSIREA
ncbi:signal recognition particle subunit SRP19, putative [Plasmodium chabaudi adami]|uniref:Signal recognition particle subunit SRP19, putative n=1 Tax=Plasmodium chabaudi adami TaxID=5826 RepID=A0A1D3S3J0_PLACE|nr:signal recognition particle subunit SRP19, putative [Plasmodium chabaudi adami]